MGSKGCRLDLFGDLRGPWAGLSARSGRTFRVHSRLENPIPLSAQLSPNRMSSYIRDTTLTIRVNRSTVSTEADKERFKEWPQQHRPGDREMLLIPIKCFSPILHTAPG
jgi:hypothetical protein